MSLEALDCPRCDEPVNVDLPAHEGTIVVCPGCFAECQVMVDEGVEVEGADGRAYLVLGDDDEDTCPRCEDDEDEDHGSHEPGGAP